MNSLLLLAIAIRVGITNPSLCRNVPPSPFTYFMACTELWPLPPRTLGLTRVEQELLTLPEYQSSLWSFPRCSMMLVLLIFSFLCLFMTMVDCFYILRRVWRYQRGNQNPYIEEEQTRQWPKEKVQKDKQRSTKHTYKTKDRVTRTPLRTGSELRCFGREDSSCSTSDTRRVNLVTNPMISHVRFSSLLGIHYISYWQ